MKSENNALKRFISIAMILMTIATASPAIAAQKYEVKVKKLNVYVKKSKNSRIIAVVKKGKAINVKAVGKKWVAVNVNGKSGFALKKGIRIVKGKSVSKGSGKKVTVSAMQNKLVSLGYLVSSKATGAINEATKQAVRVFKILNGMKVNSKANKATRKKIMATDKSKPNIKNASWSNSDISSHFKKRGKASIVDLATGKRLTIRRVGGHNHLDVEPANKVDTKKLKSAYGGTWSWDSRAILLRAKGSFYAAAMNGMPHGSGISKKNNFNGQFCIHLNGSITHGTQSSNSYHQSNIAKAYNYLSGAAS